MTDPVKIVGDRCRAPAAASGVTALAPPSGVKPQEGLEQSRSSHGAAPLLSGMREPPVVGRFYMVPTVRYRLRGRMCDWPVIGAIHEDARDLAFPNLHYHLDLRFMSKSMLDVLVPLYSDELTAVAAAVLVEPTGMLESKWLMREYGRLPKRPRLLRRRCRLSGYGYSEEARARISERIGGDKISARFGGIADAIHLRDGRRLCPHRKVDLSQFTPDADGIVACPLHGLRVRCTASVGRNAKRHDPEEGRGPQDEHAVGAAETPTSPSDHPGERA